MNYPHFKVGAKKQDENKIAYKTTIYQKTNIYLLTNKQKFLLKKQPLYVYNMYIIR